MVLRLEIDMIASLRARKGGRPTLGDQFDTEIASDPIPAPQSRALGIDPPGDESGGGERGVGADRVSVLEEDVLARLGREIVAEDPMCFGYGRDLDRIGSRLDPIYLDPAELFFRPSTRVRR